MYLFWILVSCIESAIESNCFWSLTGSRILVSVLAFRESVSFVASWSAAMMPRPNSRARAVRSSISGMPAASLCSFL